jgi:hypothetical protein
MTLPEFYEMTLAEFEELQRRRDMEIRHARFNAGLIASVLINRYRGEDSEPTSPFDFIPGFIDPEEEAERQREEEIKRSIARAFARLAGEPMEKILAKRERMIERMTANGIENAAELITEVFPNL